MKKIVHLIFTLETGGAENMLIDIANEQSNYADITVILINRKSNSELVDRLRAAVQMHSLQREEGNKRSIIFLLKLWIHLLRINPAVIHCHDHKIISLLPFFRKRAVLTVHCEGVPTDHFSKYRMVYAISRAVSNELTRAGRICRVVNNGIDFEAIVQKAYPNSDSEVAENYLSQKIVTVNGFSSNCILSTHKSPYYLTESLSAGDNQTQQSSIRLVQLGRLKHEIKGQDLLITALGRILNSSPGLDVTVDFIGSGQSEFFLRKMTTNLGLDKFVTFLGDRSRAWIYSNLHNYDIMIHPSRNEGFGLAIIEGIAAGVPVIASDVDGPAELLFDKPTGYLFEAGDADHLALVIKNVIKLLNEKNIRGMCNVSRTIAHNQYSVRQTASEYLKRYSLDVNGQKLRTS